MLLLRKVRSLYLSLSRETSSVSRDFRNFLLGFGETLSGPEEGALCFAAPGPTPWLIDSSTLVANPRSSWRSFHWKSFASGRRRKSARIVGRRCLINRQFMYS